MRGSRPRNGRPRKLRHAAAAVYDLHDISYDWIETVRYMGIFHEVQPAAASLGCLDCHSEQGRLDWQALGYKQDPLQKHLD